MPTINLEQQRREFIAQRRETMRKTLKRGDHMTLDCASHVTIIAGDGRQISVRPTETETARKAREKRAFEDKFVYGW